MQQRRQQLKSHNLSSLLEQKMASGTKRNVNSEPLNSAIQRLSVEGEKLLSKRRHDWVRKRTADLGNSSNWHAYAMEVHLTNVLEDAGHQVRNSVKLIDTNQSDVDIVYQDNSNVQAHAECVFTKEPDKFWQQKFEVAPGIVKCKAEHHGEANLLRCVQSKMREKTTKGNCLPTKFPVANDLSLNILVVDVSQGFGLRADAADLNLITLGRNYVYTLARREVLGLFEQSNPYGSDFDAEFAVNQFFRERVHAIFFLLDMSNWHSPLNPEYAGYYVINPHLSLTKAQEEAFINFQNAITGSIVTNGWLPKLSFHCVNKDSVTKQ